MTWPDLKAVVKLNNNSIFTAIPDRGEDDIRYWELFTPFDTVLKVGPENTISYNDSNEIV